MSMWVNTENHWGLVSIIVHWLSAIVVFGLFALGLWMVDLTYYDDWYQRGPFIHKSVGMSLLLLMLFRLFWKRKYSGPAQLDSYTAFEKKTSSIVHRLMYALMSLIMLSGYLISTADGRGVEVFALFEVPAIVHGIEAQEDVAGVVHLILAITLMVVVVLHMAGALKHHFIDKDLTLKRMLGIH